jgi:prepilin-type N-terminal cleavage/methylation domain-containing protein
MRTDQRGFTLLELVILLLIVGVLVAGVLKGQEMITNAKVKRVAGQLDEIRAAYLGFEDRYRALPGDYSSAHLTLNCGAPCPRGNGDRRIREQETPAAGSEVREDILAWTHLATSGFLRGDYHMADGAGEPNDGNTPKNPYSVFLQIAFDGHYGLQGTGIARHNLKSGAQIPVQVLAEVDRKMDDGMPYTGIVQFSAYSVSGPAPLEGAVDGCTSALRADGIWNIGGGNDNCGVALPL